MPSEQYSPMPYNDTIMWKVRWKVAWPEPSIAGNIWHLHLKTMKGGPGASGRVLPPVTGRSRVRVAVSSHFTGEGKACHWHPSPNPAQSGSSLHWVRPLYIWMVKEINIAASNMCTITSWREAQNKMESDNYSRASNMRQIRRWLSCPQFVSMSLE